MKTPSYEFHVPARKRCAPAGTSLTFVTSGLSGWAAFYCMCRGAASRLPYSITSPDFPGYVVHYEGNGRPPYVATPAQHLSYGGMVRH